MFAAIIALMVMKKVLDFSKRTGFFLTLAAWVFFLVGLIGYIVFSSGAGKPYFGAEILALNIVFLVIVAGLSLFIYTEKEAPLVLAIGALITLLLFISRSYMYFSVIFYSGIDFGLFFSNDVGFPLALIAYALAFLIASVAMYFKQGSNQFEIKPQKSVLTKCLGIGKLATKIVAHLATFVFAVVAVATPILVDNSSSISGALGQPTFIDVVYDDDLQESNEYFTSDKKSVKEMKQFTGKMIQEAVEEGAVLLKNEGNVLPLPSNSLISFFSSSSLDLVNGCGSSENTDPKATLKDGAIAAGLRVNTDLWDWYTANPNYARSFTKDKFTRIFTLNDAAWSDIPESVKTVGDAAVMVISRDAGEGVDPTYFGGDPTTNDSGNYLQLSAKERDVLSHLNSSFDKVIVLLNCANQVQIDFEADAILWIGNVGTTGAYGVGNLLAGKDSQGNPLSPSGHASDMFWKQHRFNPVLANFGATPYSNRVVPELSEISGICPKTTDAQMLSSNHYTVYQEGIYNGYRYAETRYADYVLGKEKVGDYDYDQVVAYPFGYGESYSDFSYSDFSASKRETGDGVFYDVSVTITNDGAFPAKETAQVYLSKPYNQYDVEHHIEKAAVELVGFGKTKALAPGESQTLSIPVSEELFASYDAYGAGTYILSEGDYFLTVAGDSHGAINNILMAQGIGDAAKSRMVGDGKADLATSFPYSFDDVTYSKSVETGVEIHNRFDNADMNRYDGAGENHVDYVSRSDWAGTIKYGVDALGNKLNNQIQFTGTDKMKADMKNPTIEGDDTAYPLYGSTQTNYRLIDVIALSWEFDDPRWNDLLDQLTWEETVTLLSNGVRSTQPVTSVSKRGTLDYNGAIGPISYNYKGNGVTGLAHRKNDPDENSNPNAYVCNGLLAATFNQEFMERYGEAMGEDCLWCGYNGLYGPGVNIHRSAYGGRGFEYYSEDPILTGKIAAAQIRGIQSYGVYCYVKHAICNDSEVMREGINVWANEQSIREIYLRPFELCIREGGSPNVMSGFNRLGLKWNGHQGYLKSVLRGEFGMEGFAVSDWYDERTWYMTSFGGLLNGNDLPDGSYSASVNSTCLLDNYKFGYGELAWAMRDAAHRMLYVIARSNVMNGMSSNMDTFAIVPMWLRTFKRAKRATNVVFGVSIGLFGAVALTYYAFALIGLRKKNEENTNA